MRWGRVCRNGKKSASREVPDVNFESNSALNSPGSFAFLWQAKTQRENRKLSGSKNLKFLHGRNKENIKASAEIMRKDQKGRQLREQNSQVPLDNQIIRAWPVLLLLGGLDPNCGSGEHGPQLLKEHGLGRRSHRQRPIYLHRSKGHQNSKRARPTCWPL